MGYPISEQLEKAQNLERFDYALWLELLNDLDSHLHIPALGLEIAKYVQPKHLGILGYIALSCENLGEALTRYHDFHHLIYDGSSLYVAIEGENLCFGWVEMPIELTTQLSNEVAMALIIQFMKHFVAHEDIQLSEVHFTHPARSTGVAIFAETAALSQLWLFWVAPIVGAIIGAIIYKILEKED